MNCWPGTRWPGGEAPGFCFTSKGQFICQLSRNSDNNDEGAKLEAEKDSKKLERTFSNAVRCADNIARCSPPVSISADEFLMLQGPFTNSRHCRS